MPPARPAQVVLHDPRRRTWRCFRKAVRQVTVSPGGDVGRALREVEAAVEREGLHAAGFLAYEAGPSLDPALTCRPDGAFPLAWFGLFDGVDEVAELPAATVAPLAWEPEISEAEYARGFAAIQEYIGAGDTYQVNYTYRQRAPFSGSPWELFCSLVAGGAPPYAAYVDAGDWVICGASPELFFTLDGETIESRPMKGTAPRGHRLADDRANAAALRRSPKERAENVMICDMVRNDIGRIAARGSVEVPALFAVEKYPTVWQMTSTVRGRTAAGLPELFAGLFPPASITGAPKRRTMQIIAELETSPRRVYTGAVGWFSPGRQAQFNVTIRTVLVDRVRSMAEYGIGGGIVHDSRLAGEWEESRVKARILGRRPPAFALLETMLWTPAGGCALLDRHLDRLAESAEYFDFPFDLEGIRQRLAELAAPSPRRVRLLLAADGVVTVEDYPFDPAAGGFADPVLAATPIDSANPFLYHKTTHRQVYEDAKAARPGAADVILYNERGEVTESTIANVVVELAGQRWTPPVECGLLSGTARAQLLADGTVRERVITVAELLAAPAVYLCNSLRGLHRVCVTNPDDLS